MWWLATAALLCALQNPDYSAEGLKALEAQKYDLAAQYLAQAVAADPKDYAALFNLAYANSMLGKAEEAVAQYRKVLELKPGLYQAELNLGILLVGAKRGNEAVPYLESAVGQKPQEFRPRLYLGDAAFQAGDYTRAEQAYSAALAADPKSADAELGLGRALARQKKLIEAEPHYKKAAELQPNYKDYALELALLDAETGRISEAIAIYQQFPENVAARERLGRLLLDSGKPADAIPHLEWAVAKSPTSANRVALAQAYRDAKQPDKELPVLAQAVEADPGNLDLRMEYGRELGRQHKFSEAAQQYFRVTQAKPDSAPAWSALAAMLHSLGEPEKALAALDRVRALGAETAGHYYLRGIILDKLRDLKGAVAAYRQFLAASQGKNPDQEQEVSHRLKTIERELNR